MENEVIPFEKSRKRSSRWNFNKENKQENRKPKKQKRQMGEEIKGRDS